MHNDCFLRTLDRICNYLVGGIIVKLLNKLIAEKTSRYGASIVSAVASFA